MVSDLCCAVGEAERCLCSATTSSENVEYVQGLGADQVIDYTVRQFETVAHDVDLVLDLVGGESQQRSWSVLKAGGILVSLQEPPSQEIAAKYGVRAVFAAAQPSSGSLRNWLTCWTEVRSSLM